MKGENQYNIQTLKINVLHRRGCTFRHREYLATAQRRRVASRARSKSSMSGHVPGLSLTFECKLGYLGDLLEAQKAQKHISDAWVNTGSRSVLQPRATPIDENAYEVHFFHFEYKRIAKDSRHGNKHCGR